MPKLTLKKSKKIVSQDLAPYSGQWVALIDNRVVSSAATLATLMKRVRASRRVKQPSVMLVPRADEGPYVLLI